MFITRRYAADHHAAEDLVQTSLTQLYVHWRRIRPAEAEAYVRRSMVNANISRWRRVRGREVLVTPAEPRKPDHSELLGQRDVLLKALAALGPRQRTAVVLRHYADLTEAETAAQMGCSIGTVKSQTARGLSALRAALALPEDVT